MARLRLQKRGDLCIWCRPAGCGTERVGVAEIMDAGSLRKAFKAFDADSSGTLDAKELLAVLTRSSGGNPLSESDAQALINEFDVNGVGAWTANLIIHRLCT